MKGITTIKRDLYFTRDHEWIDFQGSVAYVGVCSFKLLGFKDVQQIFFNETSATIIRGEVITTIQYDDYLIDVHMPVHGKIIEFNETLLHSKNLLLDKPLHNGWVALIAPSGPSERSDLLLPSQYDHFPIGKL
jgi:glycine cleavage system H protein